MTEPTIEQLKAELAEAKQDADDWKVHADQLARERDEAQQAEADHRKLCEHVHIIPLLSRTYPPLDPPELRDTDGTDLSLDHRRAMEWLVARSRDADRWEAALKVIHQAVRGDEKSEWWTLRKYLDEHGVFADDLGSSERLIEAVCLFALVLDPKRA